MIVFIKKFISHWSSPHGSAVKNLTSIHDDAGLIPGLSQRSGIRNCHELWCRWQRRLGSLLAVAVAVAGSCSSDLTPSLAASIGRGCGLKRHGKKKEEVGRVERKGYLSNTRVTLGRQISLLGLYYTLKCYSYCLEDLRGGLVKTLLHVKINTGVSVLDNYLLI